MSSSMAEGCEPHRNASLLAVAWWTIISLVVHAVQLVQAYAERRAGRPIISWMEAA